MVEMSRDAAESGAAPVKNRGWWAGAARVLGLSSSTETGGGSRNFDFAAMHRSLSSLEGKSSPGE